MALARRQLCFHFLLSTKKNHPVVLHQPLSLLWYVDSTRRNCSAAVPLRNLRRARKKRKRLWDTVQSETFSREGRLLRPMVAEKNVTMGVLTNHLWDRGFIWAWTPLPGNSYTFLFLCQVCKQGMWLCLWNARCERLWVLLSDVLRQCALTELVL